MPNNLMDEEDSSPIHLCIDVRVNGKRLKGDTVRIVLDEAGGLNGHDVTTRNGVHSPDGCPPSPEGAPPPADGAQPAPLTRPAPCKLEEVSIKTLLRMLAQSRKTAIIRVCGESQSGEICMRDGRVCYAAIENTAISPRKALHRILSWTKGTLQLRWSDPGYFDDELMLEVETLLSENSEQIDELRALMGRLPGLDAPLKIPPQLPGPIKSLTSPELDMFQSVLDHGTVRDVLDTQPISDLDTCRLLLSLMERKFISEAAKAPEIVDAPVAVACKEAA